MKKAAKYKTFVHYGCSFVFGQDSGGDGINDEALTYPAHLSRLCKNHYVNKAESGQSNDTSFFKLFCDISNQSIEKNSLIIFNISGMYRTMYFHKKSLKEYLYKDELVKYNDVLPNFVPEGMKKTFRDSYFEQTDNAFYVNLLKNIYAAKYLCFENELPIVFVDISSNLYDKDNNVDYTPFKKIKIFNSKDRSFVKEILNKDKNLISKSNHLYGKGYLLMAKMIYDEIKDYRC